MTTEKAIKAEEARRTLAASRLVAEAEGHSHALPKWIRRSFRLMWICVLLITVAVAMGMVYIIQLRTFRDEEAQRNRERATEQVRVAVCDVLDHLPAGGVLDPTREEYECGPGVPLEQLPAEARQQLQDFAEQHPLRTDNEKTLGDYFPAPDPRWPAPTFAPGGDK